ncbi:putative sugar O-methyltransferase [Brachyspira intermedia]|uniref:putative sugar O-methyltransferase n=1 Tax=Brachyspira intermedia TaxID=84377 RepID=UPI0030058DA8
MNKDFINKLVWFIPNKQLRDKIKNKIRYYSETSSGTSISDTLDYTSFCELASNDDDVFNTFRQNPIYTTVLEHTSYEHGQIYLDIINKTNYFNKENFKDFTRNDLYGGALKKEYQDIGLITPSTLRYIKVLSDLILHFGDLSDFNICEVGIGYGGQARIIMSYFKNIKSYTFIDLDPVLALSKKYLSNFTDIQTQLNFVSADKLEPKEYDLFISNYAFSELKKEIQDLYIDNTIKYSKNGYITYNNTSNHSLNPYKLKEYSNFIPKNISLYDEVPLTHPENKIIVWK